jgi:hypothetical protein
VRTQSVTWYAYIQRVIRFFSANIHLGKSVNRVTLSARFFCLSVFLFNMRKKRVITQRKQVRRQHAPTEIGAAEID